MDHRQSLRAGLGAAMDGADTPLAAADRLCMACVDLLEVDGASISLLDGGTSRGTFGSSGEFGRLLDELQFTYGEGPCVDAVLEGQPVIAADLADPDESRWPVLRSELLHRGVRAVFALPVTISAQRVGALDLYRRRSGALSERSLGGGLLAAELAALPLLDLLHSDVDWAAAAQGGDHWEQLASLERVEVYQATGMIMAAFDVSSVEALVRLRARAFALGQTASELAWAVVERRTPLGPGGWSAPSGPGGPR